MCVHKQNYTDFMFCYVRLPRILGEPDTRVEK